AEALRKHGAPVMGTTLTACRIEGGTVHLCHVGDSRCYLFRDGRLELRTEDHEFFDENLQATVLGSSLGIPTEEHPLQILEESFELRPGDGLLFCSDGLYRQIEEARMAELLRSMEEPELTLQLMCDEASQKPFSDNVTVVYVM